ncbi:MAG: esterase-like activity of phytase family protein [Candidatus Aminicenantes bacterium]|nr:esterase-like activity of phytase family protein [Candidatus Aminicenantes bacterium]
MFRTRSRRLSGLLVPAVWLVLGGLLCATACKGPDVASLRFPYLWLSTPGFGGDIDQQGIPEPSGICYHEARGTLFVVSDEGWVYEITKKGQPLASARVPGDLEGITVDPATGRLYIVIEGDDVILEFDPDRREVMRRFPVNRAFDGKAEFLEKQRNAYDNGLEALAFVPDPSHPEGGTFYAGNQWDPSCVVELLVPLRSAAGDAEARILRVLPFQMDDPAAIRYDPQTRLLDIVNDADNILAEVTLDGRLVRAYAFLGDNQEGLAKDDEGYLYIAQDTGGILKVKDLRPTRR